VSAVIAAINCRLCIFNARERLNRITLAVTSTARLPARTTTYHIVLRAWPPCASQQRAMVPLLIGDLEHAHAAPDL
jgi:hypothetical protein